MVWFAFTKEFDYRPTGEHRVTISYRAGDIEQVTRECATRATELGCGHRTSNPQKVGKTNAETGSS